MDVAVATNSAIAGDCKSNTLNKAHSKTSMEIGESRHTTVTSCLGPAAFLIRPIVTAGKK